MEGRFVTHDESQSWNVSRFRVHQTTDDTVVFSEKTEEIHFSKVLSFWIRHSIYTVNWPIELNEIILHFSIVCGPPTSLSHFYQTVSFSKYINSLTMDLNSFQNTVDVTDGMMSHLYMN